MDIRPSLLRPIAFGAFRQEVYPRNSFALSHVAVLVFDFVDIASLELAVYDDNSVTIETLIVYPEFRRRGIATAIIGEVNRAYEDRELTLYAIPFAPFGELRPPLDYIELLSFYRKLGYVEKKRRTGYLVRAPVAPSVRTR
jgi:ribosomal protein S18 acetylase RimI-like enzyme